MTDLEFYDAVASYPTMTPKQRALGESFVRAYRTQYKLQSAKKSKSLKFSNGFLSLRLKPNGDVEGYAKTTSSVYGYKRVALTNLSVLTAENLSWLLATYGLGHAVLPNEQLIHDGRQALT